MRDYRPSGGRFQKPSQSDDKHIVNQAITARRLRVIGAGGEQIGVIDRDEALRMAEEQGLDLIMVAEEADPPVCRLLDYGKLKYREQKKAAEARKNSAAQSVKELRIRYNTDKHDLEVKVRAARNFLEEGDRVRFQMRFKGREVEYEALGHETYQRVIDQLADIADVEERAPLMGRRMIMVLIPKPGSSTKKPVVAKPTA